MTTGTNFWDINVWDFIITLTVLFSAMMLANILRNTIRPIRKSMIPSSVLGGFLVLIIGAAYKALTGKAMLQNDVLEMLTYHGLGLGIVAMSLRTIEKRKDERSKTGGFDTGITVVCGYLMQGFVGLLATVLLYYAIGSFAASGLLLPMGYGQGPGQAYNWGRTYENTYGFVGGTSFGLTVAAMGFVSASIGGVIALNILRKKRIISRSENDSVFDHELTEQSIIGHNEIPLTDSMDKFTVQVSLVFIAYAVSYLFMLGINKIIEAGYLGNFGYNTVQPLIWGFNFIFGTIFALLLKSLLRFLKKKNIVHREYTSNFLQNRISGFMFDIMVVASIAAIDLSAFTNPRFVLPLAVICILGSVLTFLYLKFVCPRIFPMYSNEAFLSLYGMQTGTASTGIILLREVDPNFSTQAADNLVAHMPWAIVFGFPMLLTMSIAPQGIAKAWTTLAILLALFVAMNILLFRRYIFKKKKK